MKLKTIIEGNPYSGEIDAIFNIRFILWAIASLPARIREIYQLTMHNWW